MELRTHPIIYLLNHLPGLKLPSSPNTIKDTNQSISDALAPSISSSDPDDPQKPTDSPKIDLIV
jgi:hypothetical protein